MSDEKKIAGHEEEAENLSSEKEDRDKAAF